VNTKQELDHAYKMGWDCGVNGPDADTNCHFSIFKSIAATKEWERGKRDAEEEKQKSGQKGTIR